MKCAGEERGREALGREINEMKVGQQTGANRVHDGAIPGVEPVYQEKIHRLRGKNTVS